MRALFRASDLRGILRGTGAGRPTLFRGADGGGFGFGGLKRQADRFGDGRLLVLLVNDVAGRATGLDFRRGVAIKLDDGVQMADHSIAVKLLLRDARGSA